MINFYIYKITNTINNKIYIGKRKTNNHIDNDDYFGSGIVIRYAINKYGKDNFVKEIINVCESDDDMSEKEKYWISFYNSTDNTTGYNISTGGKGGDTYSKNPSLDNIRKKFEGDKNPMFGKSVYSVWLEKYGKEEADKKMIDRGNKQKNYTIWNKGKTNIYSEDTKNKMRNSRLRLDINYDIIKKHIDDGKNIKEICNILSMSQSLYYKTLRIHHQSCQEQNEN